MPMHATCASRVPVGVLHVSKVKCFVNRLKDTKTYEQASASPQATDTSRWGCTYLFAYITGIFCRSKC